MVSSGLRMIGKPAISWDHAGNAEMMEKGHVLNDPELLFEKIEDHEVEQQLEKLLRTKERNESGIPSAKAQKPTVPYEDFARMDIRTATVLEAVQVPGTDKLMKLVLDTGMDRRTVVSGIAEYFVPEKLVGKKVCLLANLEPRKIKGIESQGMILLAEDQNGRLVLVCPEEDVSNGSEVK